MAYSGMPSHYPHWSYGKAYEKLKTLYDHGVSGLPYEMVINSNPALAYLMRDNTLLLQILTIAHVYGHNDFFKNNFTYSSDPCRVHDRVVQGSRGAGAALRRGPLDRHRKGRAHPRRRARAVAGSCRRNLAIRKLSQRRTGRARARAGAAAGRSVSRDPRSPEFKEPKIRKVPFDPEEDLLLFIRDHNPFLSEWEKDLLTIVDEETKYFIPMIETKIMNEGWASLLAQANPRIARPRTGAASGVHRAAQPGACGRFPARSTPTISGSRFGKTCIGAIPSPPREEIKRDGAPSNKWRRKDLRGARSRTRHSFLRRYLTEELMREMDMFQYEARGDDLVVTRFRTTKAGAGQGNADQERRRQHRFR